MSLITTGAIPEDYRQFYESLPSRADVRDALAEPDVEEEDNEE